jgi:hypothetical protein
MTQINQAMREGLSVFFGGANHRVVRDVHNEPNQNDEHVVFMTGASSGTLASSLRRNGFMNVREFMVLPSASQARWVIPIGVTVCTSSGLDIYAPHKIVARAWKQLLAITTLAGCTGWARHKLIIGSRQPLSLELLIKHVMGEGDPVFSLSLGAPGRFRKLTIQIMNRDGEILGYAKLPITREAVARIRHEAATLQYLSKFSALRNQVPRLLYAGEWEDGYILIQSPAGQSQTAPGKFGTAHEQFLQRLWDIESVKKSGATLVEETGLRWKATNGTLMRDAVNWEKPLYVWRAVIWEISVSGVESATAILLLGIRDFFADSSSHSTGNLLVRYRLTNGMSFIFKPRPPTC